MKNKNLLALPAPDCPLQSRSIVTRCHNLRPTATRAALEPAPSPASTGSADWRPAAVIAPGAGQADITVYTRGNKIALLRGGIPVAAVEPGEGPFTFIAEGNLLQVIGTAYTRVYRVSATGFTAIERPVPRVRLSVSTAAPVSAIMPPVNLSKEYPSGESISRSDAGRISAAAASLWRRLDRAARNAGVWWMPVLLAARILDSRGRCVYVSAPFYAMGPVEAFDGKMNLTSGDNRRTAGLEVTAPAWNIVLEMDDLGTADGYVCEILATPMLQRVDPAAGFDVSLRRRSDDTTFCTVTGIASPHACWAGAPRERAVALERLAGDFDFYATVLSRQTLRPDADGLAKIAVTPGVAGSPAADIAALSRRVDRPCRVLPWLGAPHALGAATVASAPSAMLLVSPGVTPFRGYRPEEMAAVTDPSSGTWHALCCVTFDDGSTSVVTSEGSGGCPLSFGPVLSYPSPRAVSLYIAVRNGAGIRSGTFPLTPDPRGNRALYVDPSLAPVCLPDELPAYVVPAHMPAQWIYAGHIAVTSDGDSGNPVVTVNPPLGQVVAAMPSHYRQASWDYGRSRFTLFTAGGVCSLVIPSSRDSVSMSLIDSRVAATSRAIVDAGEVVYAVLSGELVRIAGGRITTIRRCDKVRALAFDRVRGELWLISASGHVEVMVIKDGTRYTRDPVLVPELTANVAGRSFVNDCNGYLEVGIDAPFISVDVAWERKVESSGARRGLLRANLSGPVTNMTVAVSRNIFNRAAPGHEVSLTLDGNVASTVSRRFHTRGRGHVLTLAGSAGPGFLFHNLSI